MIDLLLEVLMFLEDDNAITKYCVKINNYENFQVADWNKISSCAADLREIKTNTELEELRDFLKHNPRYKHPGQSLNKCWGKPREMPFESAGIETNGRTMKAWVNYKDIIPAGCFETKAWDNREK